jgi:hypothetical protein
MRDSMGLSLQMFETRASKIYDQSIDPVGGPVYLLKNNLIAEKTTPAAHYSIFTLPPSHAQHLVDSKMGVELVSPSGA